VLCFIGYQVVYTIVGFNSGAKWTIEALEKSWDKAYNSDQGLIQEMQSEVKRMPRTTSNFSGLCEKL
jgi:hypothetical protein